MSSPTSCYPRCATSSAVIWKRSNSFEFGVGAALLVRPRRADPLGSGIEWRIGQMGQSSDFRITSVAQLRGLIGEPNAIVHKKLLPELDDLAIYFIKRSPFLVLATADAEGNQDASPKGDHPGFVLVENPST